ncbi:hypothetical protein OUZ56_004713 [Daphnia magna]|uniref:Uncharacterized protein n=1 Tax=Daphnia magna TaxID=35525 RepID=A0ABQ9YQZ1_9CRUS|nr:hypothetical protein OUZ56_004713 [Daphnia magna]
MTCSRDVIFRGGGKKERFSKQDNGVTLTQRNTTSLFMPTLCVLACVYSLARSTCHHLLLQQCNHPHTNVTQRVVLHKTDTYSDFLIAAKREATKDDVFSRRQEIECCRLCVALLIQQLASACQRNDWMMFGC